MIDYKRMYLTMLRASERAVRELIEAQQKCEEMYLSAPETPIFDLADQNNQKEQE